MNKISAHDRRAQGTFPRRGNDIKASLLDRLPSRIPGECWPFAGSKDRRGYGELFFKGRYKLAHRVAYEVLKGESADGKLVCHECDNPSCCNPAHLWLGSHADNAVDSVKKGRHPMAAIEVCPKGHRYDEANTYRRKDRVGRNCRECVKAAKKRYRERTKNAANL